MKTRGEKQYIKMPVIAATLYDRLTAVKGVKDSIGDIARFMKKQNETGRILDVGCGPGRLLIELNKINPEWELHGLDISVAMLEVARKNLHDVPRINLQSGNISKSNFKNDYFDCIVSSGSFYNWDKPIEALNEIYRILKPGKTAFLFETVRDYNQTLFEQRLNENLQGYNAIRKRISTYFLCKQLKMTYSIDEIREIASRSPFNASFTIIPLELGNLPVYVRIELKK